ncbi:PLP-dependent aspartate aminotransferase family protein [Agrococcus sp. SCSIO52902]|uniref:trans-sulfuration enzyme family protein n=1 Tax=Agrococcus sp. SCSIO52902 TaxID=2933290 RepID=UPI001FF3A845|nr:PLP-dependent aspartate aminotransferase family protein [Agrococcus sp. SCSIO52902]UOW00182.1 PLP-dependent aspartate aminotransferase family protein [Agrococcus sp. SCSIO52902]
MTTSNDARLRLDSLAVHAGRDELRSLGVHAAPIDLSSTNPLAGVDSGGDAYERLATGGDVGDGSAVYQRLWNPTVARFEQALAALEGAEAAVAFASGMATTTAVLTAARQRRGAHVVALRPLYGGTDHLLATGLLGTETTCVDSVEAVERAVRPDTGLVIAETPANPTLELVDLDALVAAAGEAPVLVDNTFATPVLQRPLDHGAALSMHSATKYIGGHGDVLGGVVACDEAWARALRPVRAITGAIAHPLSAYLMHRGLQTLPLRVRAQQAGAVRVAEALLDLPGVRAVRFPGLDGCDPLGLVGPSRQMAGPGSMLAVDVGSFAAAAAVAEGVRLFTHAVSLGSVDSLIQHPASLTHRPVAPEAKPDAGVLRLSIGLEDPDDLIADLAQALEATAVTVRTAAAAMR